MFQLLLGVLHSEASGFQISAGVLHFVTRLSSKYTSLFMIMSMEYTSSNWSIPAPEHYFEYRGGTHVYTYGSNWSRPASGHFTVYILEWWFQGRFGSSAPVTEPSPNASSALKKLPQGTVPSSPFHCRYVLLCPHPSGCALLYFGLSAHRYIPSCCIITKHLTA